MESRREFLSDVSHRIRLVFTPNHSSWLNQIEIIFGVIQYRLRQANELDLHGPSDAQRPAPPPSNLV